MSKLVRIKRAVEVLVVGGIALVHSGIFDRLLNLRSRNPLAIHNEVLDLNIFSAEQPDQFMAELTAFSNRWNSRLKSVIEYECILSEETLATGNEPDDKRDFVVYEDNLNDSDLPASLRDVIVPSKRYFAIVGPDLTNLTMMRCVDI